MNERQGRRPEDRSEGAGPDLGPDAAKPGFDRDRWQVSRRRLERMRAEIAREGEERWQSLFRGTEQVLRECFASERIMRDPEAHRILQRLRTANDLMAFQEDLESLEMRLAEIAGQPRQRAGYDPARSAGMSGGDHSNATLNVGGRMHLRL